MHIENFDLINHYSIDIDYNGFGDGGNFEDGNGFGDAAEGWIYGMDLNHGDGCTYGDGEGDGYGTEGDIKGNGCGYGTEGDITINGCRSEIWT